MSTIDIVVEEAAARVDSINDAGMGLNGTVDVGKACNVAVVTAVIAEDSEVALEAAGMLTLFKVGSLWELVGCSRGPDDNDFSPFTISILSVRDKKHVTKYRKHTQLRVCVTHALDNL